MEYEHGVFLGVAAGLGVGILVLTVLFRKRILDCTFDERQERARGVAFKYGFFTLLVSVMVYGLSEMALGRWCDAMTGGSLCLMAGVTVFAITCILKDAYLSLREKPRYVMTLFVLLAAINLAMGVFHLLDGDVVEDGILTFRCTNLVVGIMVLVILVVYIVNFLLGQREGEE